MSDEATNNDSSLISREATDSEESSVKYALADIYGAAADFNSRQNAASTVRAAINASQPKEKQLLPSLTLSAEDLARQLQNEIGFEQMREELEVQFAAELKAAIKEFGKTGSNIAFFNKINELRVANGCNPLEYDEDLEDEAEANNDAMAQRGTVGHFAYDGWEVANGMWGMGGDEEDVAERAKDSLYGSISHRNIILNPNLTRMGASANSTYQTARFGTG